MLTPANFVLRNLDGTTVWIDRAFADPEFLGALADADRLFDLPACQIIKDQRKIKVGRIRLPVNGRDLVLYLKRYNSFSLGFKLLSAFFQSGALRALQGAAILQRARIATARPMAGVEKRKTGVLLKSFFLSEEIAGGKTVDAYWIEDLQGKTGADGFRRRRRFIERLADIFYSLHAEGIYHNDLKDANILAVGSPEDGDCLLFLLDLEGVRTCEHLSERRRIKNLVQLYRTLGIYLSLSQKLFFLKKYLRASFQDRRCKRQWLIGILHRARQVDRAKKHQQAVR